MCPIWAVCSSADLRKVDTCVRNAGRFVLGLRKYDTVKYLISTDLKWLFPIYMFNLEILKLAYDINTGNCPPYFYNYLCYTAQDNIRCTRNNSYIHSTSNVISKSFFHKAKQLWLNLPIDIQEIDSRNSFKSQLFKFYLKKQCQENIPSHDEDCCDYSCIESAIASIMCQN